MTSSQSSSPLLVAVLNLTPDSFSDGGMFSETDGALSRARELILEGACCVDIGGDSSRPGSKCTGPEEEWIRIEPVVSILANEISLSVDTHHSEVARKAIKAGAKWINDISAGADAEMFSVVAESSAKIVLTYTRCPKPHLFEDEPQGDIIQIISNFFERRMQAAVAAGIDEQQIILDPGMGAFIARHNEVSFELLTRFGELNSFGRPLMLSASRKGFLKAAGEKRAIERDGASAFVAAAVLLKNAFKTPTYLRVHNVALHSSVLSAARRMSGI
ncbi:MAG: dihydropteroate synthase [Deltaproteobacteria bacterium]|nr:dihydropteroate synthase [Deltaproteobacteria bacterium]